MPIIKCPECGRQVSSLAATCPSCGVAIAGNIVKCPHCGEIVLANQNVCPNCHTNIALKSQQDPIAAKNPSGSHRVSVGQPSVQSTVGKQGNQTGAPASDNAAEEQPNHSKSWKLFLASFLIALSIIFVGWYFYNKTQQDNETAAYENAMESNELAVLQNYLDMYPEAPQERRDSIMAHIDILKQIDNDWYNALASQSAYALERYIQEHPESVHATEARIKIDSLDWVSAVTQNTLESYKKYIEKHADGEYIDDAKTNFEKCSSMQVSSADVEMVSGLVRAYCANSANRELLASRGVDLTNADITFADDWEVKKVENETTGEMDYHVSVTMQAVQRDASHSQTLRFTATIAAGRLTDVHVQ